MISAISIFRFGKEDIFESKSHTIHVAKLLRLRWRQILKPPKLILL